MRAITSVAVLLLITILLGSVAWAQSSPPPAIASVDPGMLTWEVPFAYSSATLTIAGPDGEMRQVSYGADQALTLPLQVGSWPDGGYSYQLIFSAVETFSRDADDANAVSVVEPLPTISGYWQIRDGALVTNEAKAEGATSRSGVRRARLQAQVIPSDLVVQSSLCVGNDCANGENFGFDTIRLKENNTRIAFRDTSNSGAFPTNDWQIVANDSTNGGANYLAFEDLDRGRMPFKVMAGAPTNALYVSSTGRVGLGTGTPVLDLHLATCNTPGLRLDQSSACGWSAHIWDVAGNESNFFVRDVTAGSRLPFRIFPGAPTDSLAIAPAGIGLGTRTPTAALDIQRTGEDATLHLERTDGARAVMTSTVDAVAIGAQTNHPLRLLMNNEAIVEIDTSGRLTMSEPDGATAFLVPRDDQVNLGAISSHHLVFKIGGVSVASLSPQGNLVLKGSLSQNGSPFTGGLLEGAPAASGGPEASASPDVEALSTRIAEQDARIADLEQQNRELADRLAALEALVRSEGAATR